MALAFSIHWFSYSLVLEHHNNYIVHHSQHNGNNLQEQQIFSLVSSFLLIYVLLPCEYIKGLLKHGIKANETPFSLVGYRCYRQLSLRLIATISYLWLGLTIS